MILVGCTLAPYKMGDDEGYWASWLATADELRASHNDDVEFFAALEVDGRGLEPYEPLLEWLVKYDVTYWTFSLDDGAKEITTSNRLVRICTGRNLITEHALRQGASHILYVDADTRVPGDSLTRLLEMDWPVVGGFVPTYDAIYDGPLVDEYPFEVHEHANTAGFLLVAQEVARRLRWRIDVPAGLTDDPCYHNDATELGYPTRVRYDLIARHYPETLPPMEDRGHDRKVYR